MAKETEPRTNSMLDDLVDLSRRGKLWMAGCNPGHECDKQPISGKGLAVVKALVGLCLKHGVAPFCCVSGQDGSCTTDGIISLSPAECDDLVEKAAPFIARN